MTFDEDETSTRPDGNVSPDAQVVFRLYGELCPLDRRRFARLVEAWYVASIDQRILIESIAFEFTKPKSTE